MSGRRSSGPLVARRLVLAALASAPAVAARARTHGPYLGIAPFAGTFRIARAGARLARLLEPCIGVPLAVRTAPDFRRFFHRLLQRRYDLALAPAHFVTAAVRRGYVAVCDLDCGEGIAVIGPIARGRPPDLAEVETSTLALPDPWSLVSLATLEELRRRGLRPAAVRHLRAASYVIDLVEEGIAGLGALPARLYEEEERARGEIPACTEIARFAVPLRKTLLLAPRLYAHRACVYGVTMRAFAAPRPPDLGIAVRRVVDPDPALHARLARLIPVATYGRARAGGRRDG